MTQWNRPRAWRSLMAAMILSLLLGGAASAATFEGIIEGKVAATKTLNMEDGVRVKIQSSTQILDRNGDRVSFDDLPDPAVSPLRAMLRVEGQNVTGVLRASKITIMEIIAD